MVIKNVKAIMNYSYETDSDLLALLDRVIEGMTDNTHFPQPTPKLTEMESARNDYSTSLLEAAKGNHVAIAEKNDYRLVVEEKLCTMANYVNTNARNNAAVLATTLLPLTKDREPSHLGAVEFMKLTPGKNPGTLICKLKAVKNAKSYVYHLTDDPITDNSLWTSFLSTTCKFTFNNLTPGKKYWVKVIVGGTHGQTVQSGPISQYVLA